MHARHASELGFQRIQEHVPFVLDGQTTLLHVLPAVGSPLGVHRGRAQNAVDVEPFHAVVHRQPEGQVRGHGERAAAGIDDLADGGVDRAGQS